MKKNIFNSQLMATMQRPIIRVVFGMLILLHFSYMLLLCIGTLMLGSDLVKNARAVTASGVFSPTDVINADASYTRVYMSYGLWEGMGVVAVPITVSELVNVVLLPLVCFIGLLAMVSLHYSLYKENKLLRALHIVGILIVSYTLNVAVLQLVIGTSGIANLILAIGYMFLEIKLVEKQSSR